MTKQVYNCMFSASPTGTMHSRRKRLRTARAFMERYEPSLRCHKTFSSTLLLKLVQRGTSPDRNTHQLTLIEDYECTRAESSEGVDTALADADALCNSEFVELVACMRRAMNTRNSHRFMRAFTSVVDMRKGEFRNACLAAVLFVSHTRGLVGMSPAEAERLRSLVSAFPPVGVPAAMARACRLLEDADLFSAMRLLRSRTRAELAADTPEQRDFGAFVEETFYR